MKHLYKYCHGSISAYCVCGSVHVHGYVKCMATLLNINKVLLSQVTNFDFKINSLLKKFRWLP